MDKTKIILYTTGCPKCRILELKLEQKDIEYEKCEDINYMLSEGICEAPVLGFNDGEVEQRISFGEAIKWVNEK